MVPYTVWGVARVGSLLHTAYVCWEAPGNMLPAFLALVLLLISRRQRLLVDQIARICSLGVVDLQHLCISEVGRQRHRPLTLRL